MIARTVSAEAAESFSGLSIGSSPSIAQMCAQRDLFPRDLQVSVRQLAKANDHAWERCLRPFYLSELLSVHDLQHDPHASEARTGPDSPTACAGGLCESIVSLVWCGLMKIEFVPDELQPVLLVRRTKDDMLSSRTVTSPLCLRHRKCHLCSQSRLGT